MSDPKAYGEMKSDALMKNMAITHISVEVSPLFEVLRDAVKGYAGKEQKTIELLSEYHHPYRNWLFIVQEAWQYATSNLRLYRSHPLSGRIIYLLAMLFLEALERSERPEVRSLAADNLIAFFMKLIDEMPEEISRPAPDGASIEEIGSNPEKITACHSGILRFYFLELTRLPSTSFDHLMRSFYQPKRLATKLLRLWPDSESFSELRDLLQGLLHETYRFWLGKEDPCHWLQEKSQHVVHSLPTDAVCALYSPLSRAHYQEQMRVLTDEISKEESHREAIGRLVELPDFREIVHLYHKLPDELKADAQLPHASHLSMLMRFKIMETKGLEGIHEETLREINYDLVKLIRQEPTEGLNNFLNRIFDVLSGCMQNYPEAALQCIRTIGLEVLETQQSCLIDFFLRRIIKMGFQTPQLEGVSQHWQVRVNPAHLPNIRIWLEFIKKNPKQTKNLLSALIVYLTLGGVYIRDTDLFQKDVSYLLHAPVRPVYNLVKQLAKLFPIYFNQIGAEGQLRAVSTDVDELTSRKDRLIHFLRKQSHVEGNNLILNFIEAIVEFWRTLDKKHIQNFVPQEVFRDIQTSGPMVDDIHRIFQHLFQQTTIHHPVDLLEVSEDELQDHIRNAPDVSDRERQRAFLFVRFYQLLHEKYALSFKDIQLHLQRAAGMGLPDPGPLLEALKTNDSFWKLEAILDYLLALKEIILSPCELSFIENIYHKRHIAVDIPSMYGSYNERKFDALGLTFRLESLANLLFEEVILSFSLSFITRATFVRIAKFLPLFLKAMAIDGITSNRLEGQAELFQKTLEIRRFSHSQYIDVFRGFSEVIKQVIQTYYDAVHEDNLELIVKHMDSANLLPRFRREDRDENLSERVQRISESFLRDLVARTFGLQYFDHFISSILTTLAAQKEELSKEKLDLLLSYDPEKTISDVSEPNPMTYDLIHLGNKGLNLTQLYGLGVNVPPGFVITTEYFRCRSVLESFSQSREDFKERVLDHVKKLEAITGRCFGCASNSLLISVRSGSAVSMPGMMNSFLNVGINERIVDGLIAQTGQAWFAWDNFRRFLQSWGMSFGMQRDEFDAIMYYYKKRFGRQVKREFLPEEIQQVVLSYKHALKSHNVDFSEDPREQLFTAIRQVEASWFSPKAETYRNIMGLSENWGTAITIQAMVYGNLNTHSGAGVMFTHNPWTSEDQLYPNGDFTLGNQGEDVVGGLVKTLPLSEKQRLSQTGDSREHSLESLFPRVYKALVEVANKLVYKHNWSPQEIEFTFQGDSEDGLYVLQSRNMGPRVRRLLPVFRPTVDLEKAYLGSGIGVSGGALCGKVAFDLESIQRLRKESPDDPIILLRSDTVPDDIREISTADGILTGKGGATSHAAIVAHKLGKTCVVGFSKMKLWESDRKCVINGAVLRTGDIIGIDGRSGSIYLGSHETQQVDMVD
jgi:pyruvate,orthophosphate dikinase